MKVSGTCGTAQAQIDQQCFHFESTNRKAQDTWPPEEDVLHWLQRRAESCRNRQSQRRMWDAQVGHGEADGKTGSLR